MSWREIRIESTIKRHDKELFLNKNFRGELQIMRKAYQLVPHDFNGVEVLVKTPAPHYIMSLTADWTSRTLPVDWGLDPIVRRLQEIDGWNEDPFQRIKKLNAKVDEKKTNAFASLSEDVAKEWRKDFKKHTKDILTHSMDLTKDPRKKGDRKYGNR